MCLLSCYNNQPRCIRGPMGPMGPMAGPDGGPIQSRPRKPTAAETVAQEAQRRRDIDNWRTITMQRMKDVGYSNKAIKKFAYKTGGGDE